ncbi:patatin-like phospholipase family protein [Kineococcus sp. SYSU DK006]|uniref:patatin-like phospholipase family protein n=1 Tax=Kineococcus sp. SYSU DK006 TaxID=3383127 RepID=UPI003D7D32EE
MLGGGGAAGTAWQLGLLAGLVEQGVDVAAADLVVGTSAGSIAGALLRSGTPAGAAVQAALARTAAVRGAAVDAAPVAAVDGEALLIAARGAAAAGGTPQQVRARLGAWALANSSAPAGQLRTALSAHLSSTAWPRARLVVTAVDAVNGEFLRLDAAAGVPLLDAVAASCAVPGVWPPVLLGSRRAMDGGTRSMTNADVAAGHDRVLVVVPSPNAPQNPLGPSLEQQVASIEEAGGRALVLQADARSVAARGRNSLDPSTAPASAAAGRAQAAAVAAGVREFWG